MIERVNYLLHKNCRKMVFRDMFIAYDFFLTISIDHPNTWWWPKVEGDTIYYIPA